jgi:hypothetical protein
MTGGESDVVVFRTGGGLRAFGNLGYDFRPTDSLSSFDAIGTTWGRSERSEDTFVRTSAEQAAVRRRLAGQPRPESLLRVSIDLPFPLRPAKVCFERRELDIDCPL